MQSFHPTIILRHRKENLKKCSLHGLERREDFKFFSYPFFSEFPDLNQYLLLSFEGKELSKEDIDKGLFVLDGTWKYAKKMEAFVDKNFYLERRSLPLHYVTAYPRTQEDCSDPTRGLASIEAIYIAYKILNRNLTGLLDHYYWQRPFLEKNGFI